MVPKTVGSRAPAAAWDAAAMRVQTVYGSPRVRLVHNIVTAEEAAHLIDIGKPRYARSSTARAGSDDYRTSESAMLPVRSLQPTCNPPATHRQPHRQPQLQPACNPARAACDLPATHL